MRNRLAAHGTLWLAVAQVVVILASWIVNSAMPGWSVRSLLSSGGIRWFFGRFADNLASPLLVWLLLLSIAVGAFRGSGLAAALSQVAMHRRMAYRRRFALWMVAVFAAVYLLIIIALAFIPHAILLSSTGRLFPSSFSASIVPVVAFGITVGSLLFGLISGEHATKEQAFALLTRGISSAAPLFVVYVVAAQLYHSLRFVF